MVVFTLVGLLGRPGGAAQAQTQDLIISGGVQAGLLAGDASDFLDSGWGPWASLEWRGGGPFGWSIDGGLTFLTNSESAATGGEASNTLVSLVTGPRVGLELGRARPWGSLFGGIVLNRWQGISIQGGESGTGSALAWGGAIGLDVRVSTGVHPIGIVLVGSLMDAGAIPFARAPTPLPPDDPPLPTCGHSQHQPRDASCRQTVSVVAADAGLFGIRVGLSVGLR